LRLGQDQLTITVTDYPRQRFRRVTPNLSPMAAGKLVHHPEPHVVPGLLIVLARIPKPDDQPSIAPRLSRFAPEHAA
jgi:hypothetical protein